MEVASNLSVLLLQGPLGPFFKNLSNELTKQHIDVHRIVLNGGDQFYAGENNIAYKDGLHGWPSFLIRFLRENNIATVITFGDCRSYHFDAKRVCLTQNIRYFALEEGYLRPNYITVEEGGVNGYSPITHQAIEAYKPIHSPEYESVIPGNFLRRIIYSVIYYNTGLLKRFVFENYEHHRSFSPLFEAFFWIRSFFRKWIYKLCEPSSNKIFKVKSGFLVPLQVFNDAQIEFHSNYNIIEDFIIEVMTSFSGSKSNHCLVFKHHPMDRGHVNYKKIIRTKAAELNIQDRVNYIHDQHLPTLLKSCKGVVTINSTTALQAFYHGAPVKVMGEALFDIKGLTHQGDISSFWQSPEEPDGIFSDQFKAYLLDHGQINGSFYCQYSMTIRNLIAYLKKLKAI